MDKFQEIYTLIKDIFEGKYTSQQVEERIRQLEEKYGSDFFPDYEPRPRDDNSPWDKDYIAQLKRDADGGYSSKQFVQHIAKVCEYVYNQERKTQQSQTQKKNCSLIGIAAAAVILIIIAVLVILIVKDIATS